MAGLRKLVMRESLLGIYGLILEMDQEGYFYRLGGAQASTKPIFARSVAP
jgi:hypothetical protein